MKPRPCAGCQQPIERPKSRGGGIVQKYHSACAPKGQPPTPGKGKSHPLYQQAVELAGRIGAAKAARQLGLKATTVRNWREREDEPALPQGRPAAKRKRKLSAEERKVGAMPAWCGWCGDPLPEGFDFCDDDCRAEAKADERESA